MLRWLSLMGQRIVEDRLMTWARLQLMAAVDASVEDTYSVRNNDAGTAVPLGKCLELAKCG